MGKPQRITKLGVPWDASNDRITAKTSVVGATVIGDYYDAFNAQRVLVFERPEPPARPKPKATTRKITRRPPTQADAPMAAEVPDGS